MFFQINLWLNLKQYLNILKSLKSIIVLIIDSKINISIKNKPKEKKLTVLIKSYQILFRLRNNY